MPESAVTIDGQEKQLAWGKEHPFEANAGRVTITGYTPESGTNAQILKARIDLDLKDGEEVLIEYGRSWKFYLYIFDGGYLSISARSVST